jgi:hypothetical protein
MTSSFEQVGSLRPALRRGLEAAQQSVRQRGASILA